MDTRDGTSNPDRTLSKWANTGFSFCGQPVTGCMFTQSAVSLRIQRLEDVWDIRLFTQGPRPGAVLDPAVRAVSRCNNALSLLKIWEEARPTDCHAPKGIAGWETSRDHRGRNIRLLAAVWGFSNGLTACNWKCGAEPSARSWA